MTSSIERPTIRNLFVNSDKRLKIYFYTSNLTKFIHARIAFERAGLPLYHFKSRKEPYSEDYSAGKKQLLTGAIKEILSSVGRSAIFFVEDTSLRIEALSDSDNDYPGLAVKEWFTTTTFEELDSQLKQKNKGREATVKSDIALHIPGSNRPIFFNGSTHGKVSDHPPNFIASSTYPWLTPSSFNGWFIPHGSSKRLGEMSLEESWAYDFRTKALLQLLDRLEEYTALLNLPQSSYTRRHTVSVNRQISLFAKEIPVFIIVGRTCTGKTTFGEYAEKKHRFRFIEASSVVRMFRNDYDTEDSDPYIFAKRLLESKGPDIIARIIIRDISLDVEHGLVITGFRTIEELETIKKSISNAKVVLVDAGERIRYQRHLKRGRAESVRTIEDFREYDLKQWMFGLLRVAEDFADIKLLNEGTMEDYERQIDVVIREINIDGYPGISTNIHPRHDTKRNQLYRCLSILEKSDRPMTCDEIESVSKESGRLIRHNNANKVLKRVPELAQRLELEGTRVRYRILDAGRSYIRLMEKRIYANKRSSKR